MDEKTGLISALVIRAENLDGAALHLRDETTAEWNMWAAGVKPPGGDSFQ